MNPTAGQLLIAIDLKDPDSHLALPGTLAMLERTGHDARWLALNGRARKPPAQRTANEDRGARHRRQRDEYRLRELQYYADVLSLPLPLATLYRQPDCAAFVAALLWLQDRACSAPQLGHFLTECYRAYWSGEWPGVDATAVSAALVRCDLDGAGWLAEDCRAGALTSHSLRTVNDHWLEASEASLFSTPAYLIDEELFIGRAHLPLLEGLLQGNLNLVDRL